MNIQNECKEAKPLESSHPITVQTAFIDIPLAFVEGEVESIQVD
jgi:hypothetical protein